ncbi:unnamed protein product [Tilletia laevis]|nr:unnamed protein product [Tilletia laevis]
MAGRSTIAMALAAQTKEEAMEHLGRAQKTWTDSEQQFDSDHHDGLVHQLRMFAVKLAVSNNLERHGKDRKFYGRSELTLMLLVLEERMNQSPFTVPSSMQTQVLILLSFYSGLRPSSLVQAEVGQRSVPRIQDIKIVKRGHLLFTVEITIKNLKGFAGALDAAHRQTWIIHSVTKAHNAFFELTAVMIPWLISRGVVVDTTMNKPVPDIETFLSSSSSTFECQGSGPLFVAGRAGTAKGALGHGLLRDVTRRHYTHDTANVIWTALAMEESLPTNIKDNLERSNRFYLQWGGYATRAMAQALRRSSSDDDKSGVAVQDLAIPTDLTKSELDNIESSTEMERLKTLIESSLDRIKKATGTMQSQIKHSLGHEANVHALYKQG